MIQYDRIPNIQGEDHFCCFQTPKVCPMCHRSIEPVYETGLVSENGVVSIFYFCTGCDLAFISRYAPEQSTSYHDGRDYDKLVIIGSVPSNFEERIFDHRIRTLSPKFVEIFNQSFQAESLSLTEVAGTGYRKALEFLIKDFAIYLNPLKSDEISSPGYSLARCINDYIPNDEIKHLATATYWIGNDETHYTKRHIDKDMEDLLLFLDSIVAFITYKITAADAKSFISKTYPQI